MQVKKILRIGTFSNFLAHHSDVQQPFAGQGLGVAGHLGKAGIDI
jgi:hypothetical protein